MEFKVAAPVRSSVDVWLLLAVSAFFLILWSFAVPVFESPDEQSHWQYVRYLHDAKKLPFYDKTFIEANQPPLYYLLVAPFGTASPLPLPGLHLEKPGRYSPLYPPRHFLNADDDLKRYWPVRLARLLTCFLSVLTVYFAFLAGLEATGSRSVALLAGGLTALLPQFTFRGMGVSNDPMVATSCAIAVYLIVRLIQRGYSRNLGILIACAIAAAFLSKISAIFLPVPFALAVFSEKRPLLVRIASLFVLALSLALITPWMIRNQMLYGDPLAGRAMLTAVPELLDYKSLSSPFFVNDFPALLWRSFVGEFGWMNIPMPNKVHLFFGLLFTCGALACVWRFIQRKSDRRLLMIVFTIPVLSLLLLVQLNLTFTQPQGRYLFPALTAIMLLLAMGLDALPFWNRKWTIGLLSLLAIVNLTVLSFSIVPSYWKFPEDMLPVDVEVLASRNPLLETLHPGTTYAQSFVAHQPNLAKIALEFSPADGSSLSGDLELHLKRSLDDNKSDIAMWTFPLQSLKESPFAALRFPPIENSAGNTFYVVFQLSEKADAVPLKVQEGNALAEGSFFVNGQARPQDACFQALYKPVPFTSKMEVAAK